MQELQLHTTDPEDFEDLLLKVESSFAIQFEPNELQHVRTFGELCDHIKDKFAWQHSDDCTTQQAFYRLRQAIRSSLPNSIAITVDTRLDKLFPTSSRRRMVQDVLDQLGFKVNMLRPSHALSLSLVVVWVTSWVIMYFNWTHGLITLVLSSLGIWLARRSGKSLRDRTVGDLASRMAREHYADSRRQNRTFNPKEVDAMLIEWFSVELGLDKAQLKRDARIR